MADLTELSFISWTFTGLCTRQVKEVLDIGCRKGRYLIPLVQTGYQLTGNDNSAEMLEDCRSRIDQRGVQAHLVKKDMETLITLAITPPR